MQLRSARETAREDIGRVVRRKARAQKREAILEAKEEALRIKNELERGDPGAAVMRYSAFGKGCYRGKKILTARRKSWRREENLIKREEETEKLQIELKNQIKKKQEELEAISGLTAEEAKKILLTELENELTQEMAVRIREAEARIEEESEKIQGDLVHSHPEICCGPRGGSHCFCGFITQ